MRSLLARLVIAAVTKCSMVYALVTLQSSSVRLLSLDEYIKEAFSRRSFHRISLEWRKSQHVHRLRDPDGK